MVKQFRPAPSNVVCLDSLDDSALRRIMGHDEETSWDVMREGEMTFLSIGVCPPTVARAVPREGILLGTPQTIGIALSV
jgi:hypothetical protein